MGLQSSSVFIFSPPRLSRFPLLATTPAPLPLCHRRRSSKVADAFSVDEPITVGTGAACAMEDKAGGPAEEGAAAIKGSTGFRPVLIPQQLPWQLGEQFGIGLAFREEIV